MIGRTIRTSSSTRNGSGQPEEVGDQLARVEVTLRPAEVARRVLVVVRDRVATVLDRVDVHGLQAIAGQWANAEWESLKRCWVVGLPVPYPVQIDGTEILMEWIRHDGETAPRLAQTRPEPDLLGWYFDQLREALALMAQHGIVHGDLSPYNLLVHDGAVVVIDLPQIVEVVSNPAGMDFLHRDCVNVAEWFTRYGVPCDAEELFGDLVATMY